MYFLIRQIFVFIREFYGLVEKGLDLAHKSEFVENSFRAKAD